jgi:uncharacterized membrane protein
MKQGITVLLIASIFFFVVGIGILVTHETKQDVNFATFVLIMDLLILGSAMYLQISEDRK